MKRLIGRSATAVCVAGLIFVLLAILLPGLLGLQRFVITGGSMTGTIAKGSVIYSRVVPRDDLKVGDIITFTPPGFSEAVTHRIIAIDTQPDGTRTFSTKGDFNEVADPWDPMKLNEPRQARYVFHIPVLGYVLAALATRAARLALIGIPALVIGLSLLWSLWREAGDEIGRRVDEDGVPHDATSRA